MTASALVVVSPFGDYKQGDKITDATEVAAILAGENAAHVVATAAEPVAALSKSSPPAAA